MTPNTQRFWPSKKEVIAMIEAAKVKADSSAKIEAEPSEA